jgi:hypothetical protein
MSVLACDRNGCKNVMCDIYWSWCNKYICSDCLEELRDYRKSWPDEMKRSAVQTFIVKFFDTVPGTYLKSDIISGQQIDDEFDAMVVNDVQSEDPSRVNPEAYLVLGDLDKPFHRPECECEMCENWRIQKGRNSHREIRNKS